MAITNSMDNLYDIFQREKNRVGDEMTVFYNKNRNTLQYKNDEGTLTVQFKPEKGAENFYFRPNTEERVGIGTLVQENFENGSSVKFHSEIFDIPQEFINLVQVYQFDRDKIGVEKTGKADKKAKRVKSAEVDRY